MFVFPQANLITLFHFRVKNLGKSCIEQYVNKTKLHGPEVFFNILKNSKKKLLSKQKIRNFRQTDKIRQTSDEIKFAFTVNLEKFWRKETNFQDQLLSF